MYRKTGLKVLHTQKKYDAILALDEYTALIVSKKNKTWENLHITYVPLNEYPLNPILFNIDFSLKVTPHTEDI